MTKRKQNSLFSTLDGLVSEDHPYRKLDALLSFDELANPFLDIYSAKGRKEKGVSFGLRTLVLQFIEDISDREMERFLRENNSAKWFCELGLTEKTPDHSYFGDFRKRLGTKNIMAVFQRVRESLKAMGLIREVFTFVDASHLISKLTTWDDRDRSIKAGLEKFNNGGFQESCRLKLKSYAATFFCFSGLRNTSSTLSQFRISPLQRSGCRDFAC